MPFCHTDATYPPPLLSDKQHCRLAFTCCRTVTSPLYLLLGAGRGGGGGVGGPV